MGCTALAYSSEKRAIVSRRGIENLNFELSPNHSYYLSLDRDIVIQLRDGWIEPGESLGKLLNFSGEEIAVIPYPGLQHGKFCLRGIAAGDESGFKLVIYPYGNGSDYYLWFDFDTYLYQPAGLQVR